MTTAPLSLYQAPDAARATQQVAQLVQASRTSFAAGMACLPLARRRAMYALYAYCRVIDDIADDDDSTPLLRMRALDQWEQKLHALTRGEAGCAVTAALLPVMHDYALELADLLAILDGMRMDATTIIIAPDMATLDLYCDRVASAVGRCAVRIFGETNPLRDQVAHHLGRALQLTNILRDLAEDAARGRLYLPRELLEAANIAPDATAALTHPNLPQVAEKLAKRAAGHFVQARAAMQQCNPTAMRPARLMGGYYAALLTRLRASRWHNPQQRVRLSAFAKSAVLMRYYFWN